MLDRDIYMTDGGVTAGCVHLHHGNVDDNSWRDRYSMRINESLGLLLHHASARRQQQQQQRLLMTVASMAMPLFMINPFCGLISGMLSRSQPRLLMTKQSMTVNAPLHPPHHSLRRKEEGGRKEED